AETVTRPGVTGDHPLPIHCDYLADELLRFQWIEVDHASAGHAADRHRVDDEDDLLLRQAHDEIGVGVIEPEVIELESRPAERDRPAGVRHSLIGQYRV